MSDLNTILNAETANVERLHVVTSHLAGEEPVTYIIPAIDADAASQIAQDVLTKAWEADGNEGECEVYGDSSFALEDADLLGDTGDDKDVYVVTGHLEGEGYVTELVLAPSEMIARSILINAFWNAHDDDECVSAHIDSAMLLKDAIEASRDSLAKKRSWRSAIFNFLPFK